MNYFNSLSLSVDVFRKEERLAFFLRTNSCLKQESLRLSTVMKEPFDLAHVYLAE